MNIKTPVAGALALLASVVPSIASAQPPGGYAPGPQGGWYQPQPQPQPRYVVPETTASVTSVSLVPPAFGSVYVYEGRRLVARLDGPGVLWLPTGETYRVVAMRGDQMLWSGDRSLSGAPVELRWPAPPEYRTGMPCPYAYPRGPLTAPVERGRERTPLP